MKTISFPVAAIGIASAALLYLAFLLGQFDWLWEEKIKARQVWVSRCEEAQPYWPCANEKIVIGTCGKWVGMRKWFGTVSITTVISEHDLHAKYSFARQDSAIFTPCKP